MRAVHPHWTFPSLLKIGEEVDVQLESRLESLQAETDKLLVDITELRRHCPAELRDLFVLGLEDLERAMPGVKDVLSPLEVSMEMRQETLDKLLVELERLRQLNDVHFHEIKRNLHFRAFHN